MNKKRKQSTKNYVSKIRNRLLTIYQEIKIKISASIKLEIVTVVAIAFVIATILGVSLTHIGRNAGVGRHYYTSYTENKKWLQETLAHHVNEINEQVNLHIKIESDAEVIKEIIQENNKKDAVELLTAYMIESIRIIGDNGDYGYNAQPIEQSIPSLYSEWKKSLDEGAWNETLLETQILSAIDTKQMISDTRRETIQDMVSQLEDYSNNYLTQSQTYLVNSQGAALYQDSFIKNIDIVEAIRRAGQESEEQLTSIYPIVVGDEIGYLINESTLRGQMVEYYTDTAQVLGWLIGMISFVLLMFRFTKAKIRYIEYISYCLKEISKGNLHYKVEVVGTDELAQVATDIAHMESEIRLQIEAQKQAEKVKNELITNVAHDLRTPLTSIIGYVGLLKDEKYQDEEERKKYMEIAYQKSEKLRDLIEDLFEYTKLHNQEVKVKEESVSLTHLLNQLAEELMPLGEQRGITICTHIQTENARIRGDAQKLMRAFENLIGNAIKYSVAQESVHIRVAEDGDYIVVAIQNKCEEVPEGDLNRLFDRFYRTDASRNSETGGSGLGLAIAKNIVLLHGGQIWAQSKDRIISFNMKLRK